MEFSGYSSQLNKALRQQADYDAFAIKKDELFDVYERNISSLIGNFAANSFSVNSPAYRKINEALLAKYQTAVANLTENYNVTSNIKDQQRRDWWNSTFVGVGMNLLSTIVGGVNLSSLFNRKKK